MTTIPPAQAHGRIVLRSNWGSFREVVSVLSYTPGGSAVVVWTGDPEAETVPLSELEAIDSSPERRFIDLDAVLRLRAKRVTN